MCSGPTILVQLACGYSRETDSTVHAEESALAKVAPGDPRLAGATIYSTLEPCSQRKSRPRTCVRLILDAGIRRVVIAWREPSLFVADCQGAELLTNAGVVVAELPDLADEARAANAHLNLKEPTPPAFGGHLVTRTGARACRLAVDD